MIIKSKKGAFFLSKKCKNRILETFLSPEQAAQMTHRSQSTARRWLKNEEIDPANLELIMLKTFGVVPFATWKDWEIRPEGLLTPEGDFIDINRLSWLGLYMSVYNDLQEQNRTLLEKIKELKARKDKRRTFFVEPTP